VALTIDADDGRLTNVRKSIGRIHVPPHQQLGPLAAELGAHGRLFTVAVA
jgi:hypothetical protein